MRAAEAATEPGLQLDVPAAEPMPAGAFAVRMRTLNGAAYVNFRSREVKGQVRWLHLYVTPDGRWSLWSALAILAKDEWVKPPGIPITQSEQPDPELAAGKWFNVAGHWSDSDYEVWLNGQRIAGGRIQDPDGFVPDAFGKGFQVGTAAGQPGQSGFELDYAAIWDAGQTKPKTGE